MKRTLGAIALVVMIASGAHAADCLSDYAFYLWVCDNYTSGFQEIGCNMDAVVAYWDCVANAALS